MDALLTYIPVFLTGGVLGAYISSAIAQHRMNGILENQTKIMKDQKDISAKQEETSRYLASMTTYMDLKEMGEEATTIADNIEHHLQNLRAIIEKVLSENHTEWEIQRIRERQEKWQARLEEWDLECQLIGDLRRLYAEYIFVPMIELLTSDADEETKKQLWERLREIYSKQGIDIESEDA